MFSLSQHQTDKQKLLDTFSERRKYSYFEIESPDAGAFIYITARRSCAQLECVTPTTRNESGQPDIFISPSGF